MMQPSPEAIESLSYEQAFAELEEIVYGLETNSKTLEESIAMFERGQALAQHCVNLLDKAELRVRQLHVSDEEQTEDLENSEF